MMAILIFFILHWYLSLFVQTIFLHRYASHKMFTMSPFMEKVFFVLTALAQGTSFLRPSLYGVMHNKHHEHSDTEKDPHSPVMSTNYFSFMNKTLYNYQACEKLLEKKPNMLKNYPSWPIFEKIFDNYTVRFIFLGLYIWFYFLFAPSYIYFLLIPIHALMGPIHGFIVNWFGHKHGYRNFDSDDNSKNTLPVDVLMSGELYQNNHHKYPKRANFAVKFYEFDLGFWILWILNLFGLIKLNRETK